MPKTKTRRAAAKRFRVTAKGKVMYVRSGLRHNLEHKPASKRRKLGKPGTLGGTAAHQAKRLLGRS
jgi:large subunit ribosomal protein L35